MNWTNTCRSWAITLLLMGFTGLFSSTMISPFKEVNLSSLNPDNYQYYFVLNNEIRDVRDFRLVNKTTIPQTESIVFLSEDEKSLFVGNYKSRKFTRHNLQGIPLHSFQMGKTDIISYDWTYKVYVKDQDVWRADLNWQTGKEENHRQLTQLGTFNPLYGMGYAHWYKDIIVILIGAQQQCYLLNAKTGTLQEMIPSPEYCYWDMSSLHSPTGRYIKIKDYIIDLETLTSRQQLGLGDILFWQDDNTLFVPIHNNSAILLDIKTGAEQPSFKLNLQLPTMENPPIHDQWKPYRWFSPSGRYLLFHERDNQSKTHLWVGDTENHLRIKTDIDITKNVPNHSNSFDFNWITNGNFIYVNKGNPLTQGTWFYDIHTQEHKKITPYLAKKFVVMKEAGMIVFLANNHVYKVALDGSNLKQLTTQPLNRWNQTIAPFLTN